MLPRLSLNCSSRLNLKRSRSKDISKIGHRGNELPFFLVTHTSLVEADDEHSAADKAVAELRQGGQVTVAVKSDELTITHLIVEACRDARERLNDDQDCNGPTVLPRAIVEPAPDIQARQVDTQSSGWRISVLLISVGLGAFVAGTITGFMV